jgi:hypothetical protein
MVCAPYSFKVSFLDKKIIMRNKEKTREFLQSLPGGTQTQATGNLMNERDARAFDSGFLILPIAYKCNGTKQNNNFVR